MRSFSMMGAMEDGEALAEGGGDALPPTVHMPSTTASTGCSLGGWRIIEAGGGFNGRCVLRLMLRTQH